MSFRIRDKSFRLVGHLGSAPLLEAIAHPNLERVDIWSAGMRKCQIGFAWADGSTAIGDVPWSWMAAKSFFEKKGLSQLVRLHVAKP